MLFRHVLAPCGRQAAGLPCRCGCRRDGGIPKLDGLPVPDHLSADGCPTRSVAALCSGCGSMVWTGDGADACGAGAMRPVRPDRPARPDRAGSQISQALGCGGRGAAPAGASAPESARNPGKAPT
jgi:hypothetical protein